MRSRPSASWLILKTVGPARLGMSVKRHVVVVGGEAPAAAASDGSPALVHTSAYHLAWMSLMAGLLDWSPQLGTGVLSASGLKYAAAFAGSAAASRAAAISGMIMASAPCRQGWTMPARIGHPPRSCAGGNTRI